MGVAVKLTTVSLLASNEMVERYLPLVRRVAGQLVKRKPPDIDFDDLVSWGMTGLFDAIRKYNPRKSRAPFPTYAVPRIRGAIFDEWRRVDPASRGTREKEKSIQVVVNALEIEFRRAPTGLEVADELGLSLERYERWRFQAESASEASIDTVREGVCRDEERERAHDPLKLCLDGEQARLLMEAIATLPEREQSVIELYYWRGLTMQEIGDRLGYTLSRVSQIHFSVIKSLRRSLGDELRISD